MPDAKQEVVKVLSDDALREIEARANAATDGPWGVLPSNNGTLAHVETQEGTTAEQGQGFTVCSIPKKRINDAEFMAHAREDIPALCATVRALRASDEHNYQLWLDLKERHQHKFASVDVRWSDTCQQCGATTGDDHDGYDCIAWLQRTNAALREQLAQTEARLKVITDDRNLLYTQNKELQSQLAQVTQERDDLLNRSHQTVLFECGCMFKQDGLDDEPRLITHCAVVHEPCDHNFHLHIDGLYQCIKCGVKKL